MKRGQRYFLIEAIFAGTAPANWQKGLLIELEKLLGSVGLGATEASFVREGKGLSGGRLGSAKIPENCSVIRTSVSGQGVFRGALAIVTAISGVPARLVVLGKSGTLKGILGPKS